MEQKSWIFSPLKNNRKRSLKKRQITVINLKVYKSVSIVNEEEFLKDPPKQVLKKYLGELK